MRLLKKVFFGFFLLLLAGALCQAEDSASKMRLDIKEFTLKNGMLFLIVERPTTPQVACRVAIRAGSALEEAGKTGIAHLLEHMMFKGTKNFGTLDFKKDQERQERIEAAYQVVLAEEQKRSPNQALIKEKFAEMDALRKEVQKIYVPQAFSSQLGRNGAVGVNAFTSKDQTQYTMSVPSDMLEQFFSIVSEQLFEPSWREFYVEKEVVQREWAFRYINNPEGAAWLDLDTTAYTAHPYRNPTIGWQGDMERYNTEDAMAFHKRYYNPTNAVCVLVGDVKLEDARRLAEIYFGRYPSGRTAPEEVTKEPPQQGPRKSIRFLKGARTPLVRIGFHGARMGLKDFYALDALTMVLSHGLSARMTQNIINKGLAIEAWAYDPDNRYGGMVILGGSPNEPDEVKREEQDEGEKRQAYLRACENLEDILLHEVEKLKTEPVSESELRRIKKLSQRDFLDRIRSNEELAGTLATLEVEAGWRYLTTYLERIDEITSADIMRVANEYIRGDNKTSVYVVPGGEPERPIEEYTEVRSVSGAAAARAARPTTFVNHSVYPTPEGWKHPLSFQRKPKKVTYPKAETAKIKGTTLFYLPDHGLPLVDLILLVKVGAVDVSETQMGLTDILDESLIRGGTEKYPPHELAMVLDENAIQLSVSFGAEVSSIRLSVIREDWDKGLALLKEILTQPRFDPELLDVVKQQALIALQRQGGDATAVMSREGLIWQFKGHPYGRDPLQGLKTIPSINREDLKGFLRRYLVPSNMVVAVAGDIAKAQVLEGIRGFLQDLPGGIEPEGNLNEPAETPPVLALINKPGQVQSQVRLALRSVNRTNPAYWRMSLLMNIFGGNDSIMYTRLRDDLGLVYAAWFYQTYKWKAGMLVGYIGCKGDKTSQAIGETVEIMTALRQDVPEEELEQKRLDALNSFIFNVDTPTALVETYAHYFMRKEPLDTLERIQDAYISVTRGDLRDLARKFLDPKKLQVFIVADKTIRIKEKGGKGLSLEEDLKNLAMELGLPYKEIALR
ncbi:MAG: pitrilysin family protein [Pseudomonadota bacterium]